MATELPWGTLATAAALTLLPFLLLATTSFVKLSVVLSLLRNALGLDGVPSGLVITLLAALLSLHVMAPVLDQVVARAEEPLADPGLQHPVSKAGLTAFGNLVEAVAPPIKGFLARHAGERERELFVDLAKKARPDAEVSQRDFAVLMPAFLISELAEALKIGFMLFLPFLVVDLVIASLLTGLGMTLLNPASVAVPFKLLLFVLVDGFYLLSEALVSGYL